MTLWPAELRKFELVLSRIFNEEKNGPIINLPELHALFVDNIDLTTTYRNTEQTDDDPDDHQELKASETLMDEKSQRTLIERLLEIFEMGKTKLKENFDQLYCSIKLLVDIVYNAFSKGFQMFLATTNTLGHYFIEPNVSSENDETLVYKLARKTYEQAKDAFKTGMSYANRHMKTLYTWFKKYQVTLISLLVVCAISIGGCDAYERTKNITQFMSSRMNTAKEMILGFLRSLADSSMGIASILPAVFAACYEFGNIEHIFSGGNTLNNAMKDIRPIEQCSTSDSHGKGVAGIATLSFSATGPTIDTVHTAIRNLFWFCPGNQNTIVGMMTLSSTNIAKHIFKLYDLFYKREGLNQCELGSVVGNAVNCIISNNSTNKILEYFNGKAHSTDENANAVCHLLNDAILNNPHVSKENTSIFVVSILQVYIPENVYHEIIVGIASSVPLIKMITNICDIFKINVINPISWVKLGSAGKVISSAKDLKKVTGSDAYAQGEAYLTIVISIALNFLQTTATVHYENIKELLKVIKNAWIGNFHADGSKKTNQYKVGTTIQVLFQMLLDKHIPPKFKSTVSNAIDNYNKWQEENRKALSDTGFNSVQELNVDIMWNN